jgi:hypothetical protein
MANLFNLDFNAAKTALKTFISNTDDFKDYNFEGSAINELLNVLASFTEKFSFYLNNVANEFFILTAQNEDNIYKLANMLNYLPSRKVSPSITISLTRIGSDNIHIPKFSAWTMGSLKLTNLTDIDITDGATHEVTLNEGTVITETFTSDGTDFQTFSLTEREKVDNDTLFVYVDTPDGLGSYTLGTENWKPIILLDLNESGNNYYINYFSTFDIRFDDGSVFTKPAENDRIRVIYNKTLGATNNGSVSTVTLDNTVLNAKLTITNPNNDVLVNGLDEESITAIQQRASGAFSTQSRAITQSDYDNLIKTYGSYDLYSGIKIWGGETEWIDTSEEVVQEADGEKRDLGHIYLSALRATTYNYLTQTEINNIESFLDKKKILTLFFRFLHPNIIEITPSVQVKYKSTILPNFDTDLISDINTYLDGLEGFDGIFNQSNLDQFIDSQDNVDYMSSSVATSVLVKSGAELSSTASGGSATTLIDSSLIGKYSDDYFQKKYIHHLTGTNAPQTMVTGTYDDSTGTFTFAQRLTLADASAFTVGESISGDGVGGNDGVGVVVEKNVNDVYVNVTSGTFVASNGVDDDDPFVSSETTISSITTYLAVANTDTYEIVDFNDYNAIRLNQPITSGSISETISTPSATTSFTATGGSTTTLVDTTNLEGHYKDDYWNTYTLKHLTGTNAPQTLTITDYDDSTGTLTFATALAINAGDTYRLEGTLADNAGDLEINGTDIGDVDYTNGWITYTYNFGLDSVQFDFTFDNTLALAFDRETFLKFTDLTSITAL